MSYTEDLFAMFIGAWFIGLVAIDAVGRFLSQLRRWRRW